jgi:hypothetical protein
MSGQHPPNGETEIAAIPKGLRILAMFLRALWIVIRFFPMAHFAGAAGAVAVLTAMEDADAALVMANADASGRTKRENLIKANPFLERFTVTDLRNWADRKMQVSGL